MSPEITFRLQCRFHRASRRWCHRGSDLRPGLHTVLIVRADLVAAIVTFDALLLVPLVIPSIAKIFGMLVQATAMVRPLPPLARVDPHSGRPTGVAVDRHSLRDRRHVRTDVDHRYTRAEREPNAVLFVAPREAIAGEFHRCSRR